MARMAELIEVRREGSAVSFKIDGEEFPWFTAVGGPVVGAVGREDVPTVTVTILADRVEALDSLKPPPPPRVIPPPPEES